ncbi:MAG: DUF3499 domain-containing protein [Candidatus Planktophila sp.]
MSSHSRYGRACSRTSCRLTATMTLTYNYADSTAVIGSLATFSEPHAYDLCEKHGERLTVPNGWNVIKASTNTHDNGPTHDDLMAIADAVREAGSKEISTETPSNSSIAGTSLGRRGHLRAVPS